MKLVQHVKSSISKVLHPKKDRMQKSGGQQSSSPSTRDSSGTIRPRKNFERIADSPSKMQLTDPFERVY